MQNERNSHARPASQHRSQAPVLRECPECLYLLPEPEFSDGATPCRNCGATSPSRKAIPAHHLRRFDERIRGYAKGGEHEIVVILVSTLLETIFEDILTRMMQASGADTKLTALVLDTERSVGLRLGKLYPTLAGASFEDIAAELGYADFPHRWRQMRAARNAFIHGESFDNPRETLDARAANEAMSLLDQAYDLFVMINNRFVADGPRAKRK